MGDIVVNGNMLVVLKSNGQKRASLDIQDINLFRQLTILAYAQLQLKKLCCLSFLGRIQILRFVSIQIRVGLFRLLIQSFKRN